MDVMRQFVLASSLPERRREILLSESILRNIRWQSDYPTDHISTDARLKLEESIRLGMGSQGEKMCRLLIRIFEAYLAVTKQKVDFSNNHFRSEDVLVGFAGALYSERFLHAKLDVRYKWAYGWKTALAYACPEASSRIPRLSTNAPTDWFETATAKFERLPLDRVQVDLWRGWPIPKTNGQITWANLRNIYSRYGKDFAEAYAVALAGYAAGRRVNGIVIETAFADFLARLPASWLKEDFASSSKLTSVLINFLIFQCKAFGKEENQYSTLVAYWNRFVAFATTYLCTGKFFARLTAEELPSLSSKEICRSSTHLRQNGDGETYIAKLLADVPLQLSDEEATDLIYFKIQENLDLVKSWAESEVNVLWARLERRRQLAKKGTVKEVLSSRTATGRGALIDRTNPDWAANACATFEKIGFRMRVEGRQRTLYPEKLGNMASEVLALPTTGALVPHMTLLVIEHPKLTASFFEKLRLYDGAGQLSGIAETDNGWVLDGDKLRRGPGSAEQQIHLSDRGAEIVAQVIEITQPLRDYLRNKNDPNWRYLFLGCGKGFSYPSRLTISHDINYHRRSGILEKKLLASGGMTEEAAGILAARFSLATVRATAAVVAYIRRPDIQKLSEILGHKKLDIRLLERYLPAPLLRYFEERWVRLFQCGILVEALKESKYLLPAAGFKTLHELNEFISNHALKWVDRKGAAIEVKTGHLFDSVVFSISEETLMLLVGIRAAVENADRPVSKLAEMWVDYAERLFAYIQDSIPPRDDFRAMLAAAKERDCIGLIYPEAIYA
jgi:hypothetical protein